MWVMVMLPSSAHLQVEFFAMFDVAVSFCGQIVAPFYACL
jgi:hypothetical protein